MEKSDRKKAATISQQSSKPSSVSRGPRIPSQPVSKGLSYRPPRESRREDLIHKRLKKKSPWYQSILDPIHGADAKIPDETGVETGTMQLVQRSSFTTNQNGVGGIKVHTPYINNAKTDAAQVVTGSNWQMIDPNGAATTISLVWGNTSGAGGAWVNGASKPFENINALQSFTNQHRIVSASLSVQPEVSLAFNEGEYCLFRRDFAEEAPPTYESYVNIYKAITVPLSAEENAGTVLWFPVNRQDWSFKSFIRTDGTNISHDDDGNTSLPFWTLGVVCNCHSAVTFRVTFCVNYEYIPRTNILNILDTSPSPQDATETDLVERWVQDDPGAAVVPTKQISSSPSTVNPQPGENDSGTGFGMFFNVISELAPLAMALL